MTDISQDFIFKVNIDCKTSSALQPKVEISDTSFNSTGQLNPEANILEMLISLLTTFESGEYKNLADTAIFYDTDPSASYWNTSDKLRCERFLLIMLALNLSQTHLRKVHSDKSMSFLAITFPVLFGVEICWKLTTTVIHIFQNRRWVICNKFCYWNRYLSPSHY